MTPSFSAGAASTPPVEGTTGIIGALVGTARVSAQNITPKTTNMIKMYRFFIYFKYTPFKQDTSCISKTPYL
jgi:hypothetical protein